MMVSKGSRGADHGSPRKLSTPLGSALMPFDAVIFDMDGVVTDTAATHAEAWKMLFDSVLDDARAGASSAREPFDPDIDYTRYVDGRAREDGVRSFLLGRGISLPDGLPGDAADAWTVHGLAVRKNEIYLDLLAAHGLRVFSGTVDLLRRLRAGGVATGLVTASRNAGAILASTDVQDLFDVVVDGTLTADLNLPGKPDPAAFVEASRRIGVPPERAAVVEDAVAGVQAARVGGFRLVVGIDRHGDRESLERAGADLVLTDVSQLDLGVLRVDPWLLTYVGFDPAHEGHREALTTLANGYFGTRGAAPERRADESHYPGTYLAGIYNRVTSTPHGRRVEDEHLVNAPNWLCLDIRVGQGGWLSEGGMTIRQERRDLDLRTAVLTRHADLMAGPGRRVRLTQRRLVSMAQPHVAALETTLIPEGWSGTASVWSGVDAGVTNSNVSEYRGLENRHLSQVTVSAADPDVLVVHAVTSQSQIGIAVAARSSVRGTDATSQPTLETRGQHSHGHRFDVHLIDGQPTVVDKVVSMMTSRDPAIASPALGSVSELNRAPKTLADLLPSHEQAWSRLWARWRVALNAPPDQNQLVLNLHTFHLLQTVSPHMAQLDAGVPARGLHGEGYRGHVFWDELFVMPLVTAHVPRVARSLLEYRWKRLDAARDAAAAAGLAGALFPWQSGSDGREETPLQLFNLRSGRWMADNSRRQRHVGLAVAYNAWQYYQATGDTGWLARRGAELIIEVARAFTSMSVYNESADRFHIVDVMGPDEYHDGYPDAPGLGVRDNAYTNVMAAWVCARAVDALAALRGHVCDDLVARLHIGADESSHWQHFSRRVAVPFHGGVVSQFDGYDELLELDWPRYRAAYGNIGRLDLILEAEGDTTNRYKVAKQADVLMLFYLLGSAQLQALLGELGYAVEDQTLASTVEYYLARTAHGSTLSRVVHASALSRMDPSRAWVAFREALVADLDDTQGGTTQEGVHLGAMAGTVDILTRNFAGLQMRADRLIFEPHLPEPVNTLQFQIRYRGQCVDVALNHHRLRLVTHECTTASGIQVEVWGKAAGLRGDQTKDFPLA
jgi:beta-phosphoglucomutase family hydrolase